MEVKGEGYHTLGSPFLGQEKEKSPFFTGAGTG